MFTLKELIVIFFKVIEVLIILRIISSWLIFNKKVYFIEFLHDMTEPILKPFRIALFLGNGIGVDLSPLIALIILTQIEILILNLI